jgi:hypothetical protein
VLRLSKKQSAAEFSQAMRNLVRVPAQVAAEVAKEIHFEIQVGFDTGSDPYKHPWAPLRPATLKRHPHRKWPPLTDTRKGRNGIKVKPVQGAGVQITSFTPYMRKHQSGAPERNLVARPFLPKGVLPKNWAARYQAAYRRRFKIELG